MAETLTVPKKSSTALSLKISTGLQRAPRVSPANSAYPVTVLAIVDP